MNFIRRHFGTLLIFSALAGLFVPSAGDATPVIVMVALAFIIFCSFFQINFNATLLLANTGMAFRFWLMRFIVIPIVLFFVFSRVGDFISGIILLSFLLPAAVSSPAFAVIYGGKPDLSLKILIISSFLSVLTIPLLLTWLLGSTVKLDALKMLLTLVYTILVPFLLHLPLRKITPLNHFISRNNPILTLAGLGIIFILVSANNKDVLLGSPQKVLFYALISVVIYGFMYLAGYFLFPSQSNEVRRTFAITSGANNIGLGVTITALFFQGEINAFFIVSQLIWVAMLIPLRKILKAHG